jgi:hypothetical protein
VTYWNRSKYGSILGAARAELGQALADDPLAQHLALQIEAAELALEHRVDWLVEKRDDELEARRQASEATLDDTSFTSPDSVWSPPPPGPMFKPRQRGSKLPLPAFCESCGRVTGMPHATDCPAMRALIK